VAPLRLEAGCFVLLTNLVYQQEDWSAPELLTLYKSQIGIEKNFSFLKDPAIVNSIFLKKSRENRSAGPCSSYFTSDLAANGKINATVCRNQ
jgi:hypothetical protein